MTMRFSGNRSFSALLCLSILSIPVAAAAQKYNVLDLGSGMVATDLNNRLEVVGYAPTTQQAYVWSPSGVQSLGPVEADAGLFINNSGIVVGLRLVNGRRHPFAWVNGSPVALPAPADDEIRAIRGLTDNGIVLMESTQRSWGIYNGR